MSKSYPIWIKFKTYFLAKIRISVTKMDIDGMKKATSVMLKLQIECVIYMVAISKS